MNSKRRTALSSSRSCGTRRGRNRVLQILTLIAVALVFVLGVLLLRPTPKSNLNKLSTGGRQTISAIVVPHFNWAAQKRSEFMSQVAKQINPNRIILFSVNHFNRGDGDIITTAKSWQTQDGKSRPEQQVVNALEHSKIANIDENAFYGEHGIDNVVPDLIKYFPHSSITPVIIKDSTAKEKIDKLIGVIGNVCGDDCLLVSSIDFSHYLPASLAEIHDTYALQSMYDRAPTNAWKAETDSPQIMYLTTKWAENRKSSFNLFYHSNSGLDQKSYESETTSYIIGSYGANKDLVQLETSTFIMAGDLMLDRSVNHIFKNKGFDKIFEKLGNRIFWGADAGMLNNEGPISQDPIDDNIKPNNLVFNFPPQTIDVLKLLKLDAVSLANNHTLNAGQKGLDYTRKILGENKIVPVGDPEKVSRQLSVWQAGSAYPVSVIAVNMLGDVSPAAVSELIKTEVGAGRAVVVFPHWGNEYQTRHNYMQEETARAWIEAGAIAVIGSHPHVVQDGQILSDRPVVYSMGNFVFDQWFSKETQQGLIIGGIIKKDSITLSFFPISLKQMTPQLLTGSARQEILSRVMDGMTNKGIVRVRDDTVNIRLSPN